MASHIMSRTWKDRNKRAMFSTLALIAIVLTTKLEYSSGTHLSQYFMALAHRDFLTAMEIRNVRHYQGQEPLPKAFQVYLDDFSNGSWPINNSSVRQHMEEAVRNPLATFRLIHRVANYLNSNITEWEAIPGLRANEVKEDLGNDTVYLKKELIDAAAAILRIHFMHSLNASDLAAGKVSGTDTRTQLLASHCFYIGLVANLKGKHALAIEWLDEARRLASTDGTVDIPSVQAELLNAIKEHDSQWRDQDSGDTNFFSRPLNNTLRSVDNLGANLKVKDLLQATYAGKGTNCSYWQVNTWGLCSGQHFHAQNVPPDSFCWLEFKVNKVFTIGPLKMEFLSRDPDVVEIHEAFGESDLNEILGESEGSSGALKLGNSTEGWINMKISALTGLRATEPTGAEKARVVNSITGGEHYIYVDAMPEKEDADNNGNRIATLMVHLNDVEKGGCTAFQASLVSAKPAKGSAIFWFNLFPDSTPDYSTAHADCPVVLGQKWAIYKNIRFYDQFLVKKCPLGPKERFQFPVNGELRRIPMGSRHKLIDAHDFQNVIHFSVAEGGSAWDAIQLIRNYTWKRRLEKYACASIRGLNALMRLERDIYFNVKRIFTTTIMERTGNLSVEKSALAHREKEMVLRYLENFNEPTSSSSLIHDIPSSVETTAKYAFNPLAVYRIVWRFENYVKHWLTQEPEKQGKLLRHIREYITKVYNMSEGPLHGDLEDAMTGILQVQHVHDLRAADIASGLVLGTDVGIVLSAAECIDICQQAITVGYYYLAVDWMEVALRKILSEGDSSIDLPTAKLELATAKAVHDKFLEKSGDRLEPVFYAQPISDDETNSTTRQTIKQVLYEMYRSPSEDLFDNDIQHWTICQGKSHQTLKQKSRLFCWHETHVHPYWKIGPLRAEILSVYPQPEVVKYHDVIGERLMAFLRNDTNREFIKPTTQVVSGPEDRLSSSYWMRFNGSTLGNGEVETLRLVNRITGLKVMKRNQETWVVQFGSYTPGGHYRTHMDTMNYAESPAFARLATFMFYLTDTLEGGETTFSHSGALATPKKGAALFWYNMLNSGDKDDLTEHGSCPVIFGGKLIATYWMNYDDQTQFYCHAHPKQRIEVLMNGKSKYDGNYLFKPRPRKLADATHEVINKENLL